MDFLKDFINEFGLLAGFIVFAAANYIIIARSANRADTKARDAVTAQQEAITEQFKTVSSENRRLQAAIDALDVAQAAAADERMKIMIELETTKRQSAFHETSMRAAQEKAAALEAEVKMLASKIMVLENEKTAQAGALEREKAHTASLKVELAAANEQIVQLKERVSKVEGEKETLRSILDKIQVVTVNNTNAMTEEVTSPKE